MEKWARKGELSAQDAWAVNVWAKQLLNLAVLQQRPKHK